MNSDYKQIINEIFVLIKKDIFLELKHKNSFFSIILYLVTTIFICYISIGFNLENKTWISLYWIIVLFASANAINKSFLNESKYRKPFIYQLAHNKSIIIAKIIYNTLIIELIIIFGVLIYSFLMFNRISDFSLFLVISVLSSFGLSSILTLIAAISTKSENSFTLSAILSFPLIMPLLILIIKLSLYAVNENQTNNSLGLIFIMLALTVMTFLLSTILFEFLWKE